MTSSKKEIDIFEYEDYKKFLGDWYFNAKKNRRDVTYRYISKSAGFSSPNFFKRIIDGTRNLSHESAGAIAKVLKLNKRGTEFFINLVHFNQATSHREKDEYYQKILQSQKFLRLKPMAKDQYEYCAHWYHPVVRELVVSENFSNNWDHLGKRITPPLSANESQRSVELLERLGLIKKDEKGHWSQASPIVTSGPVALDLSVINYHSEVLDIVKERIVHVPEEKRDISALTLGVTSEMIPVIKEKIRDFRRDVLQFVTQDPRLDKVILLTIQMIPVTSEEK